MRAILLSSNKAALLQRRAVRGSQQQQSCWLAAAAARAAVAAPGASSFRTASTSTSADALPALSRAYLAERKELRAPRAPTQNGILHCGVGNFHRAHQAVYLDDYNQQASDPDDSSRWGIVGAEVCDSGGYAEKRAALQSQDHLYTVVTRDAASATPRVVASITATLPHSKTHGALKRQLLDPRIRIVSLTVTEGGYFLRDGQFDPRHPAILHDIQHPGQPQTIFGLILQALKKRRAAHIPAFTVMSCDNVPHNGDICRAVVLGLAGEQDDQQAEFRDWIANTVQFPNSMVDRITPATGRNELDFVPRQLGYRDAVPVFCEPYRQWVLEDKFVDNDRPALEEVGVQFVDDVAPYENAKIRILNGGHASLAYPSALLDVEHVSGALEHPLIGPFLDKLERREIVPHVPPVPGTDLVAYWETVRSRFANPTIMDRIDRNCADGSHRQPKFVVSNVKAALASHGGSVDGLALVTALWCRYCRGVTETGAAYTVKDPAAEQLRQVAVNAPETWLDAVDVYEPVRDDPKFRAAFSQQLDRVLREGVAAALQAYMRTVRRKIVNGMK